jgi:hypothetical protein
MLKRLAAIFILPFILIPLAGCPCGLAGGFDGKKPISYNVTVSLDDEMRQSLGTRKVEVDLVGINEKQNERWQNYSMTKYWQPGDALSGSVQVKKLIFDPGNTSAQTLSSSDPIWDTWLKDGANRLYVLTLLPGITADAEGDKDPRRQIEPLACYRWLKHDGNIEIKVQRTGIITTTMLRPEH